MGILNNTPPEIDLRTCMTWIDMAIRQFELDGMVITRIIAPMERMSILFNRTVKHPLPKTNELRIDKGKKGLVLYIRDIPVTFGNHLSGRHMFVISEKKIAKEV